jgi:hypothetical protein
MKYGCLAAAMQATMIKKYTQFCGHPIWLLNGIFVEQHAESRGHRVAIAEALRLTVAKTVLDFGG